MRPVSRKLAATGALLSAALAVSACSGSDSDQDRSDENRGGGGSAGSTRLEEALDRLDASTLDRATPTKVQTFDAIMYGDNERIAELATDDEKSWSGMLSWGGPGPETVPSEVTGLGLDLAAASYSISVGFGMPDSIILISGGQSEDAVREGAEKLGYTGGDILDGAAAGDPVSWATQVQPVGEDVVLGRVDADLAAVDPDGDTLLDEQKIADVAGCLDDPLAAVIGPQGEDGDAIGIGLSVDGEEKLATYCLAGDEARADALAEALDDPGKPASPYGPALKDIEVEISDGMIRATATIDDRMHPNAAFSPYLQQQLTGV